VEHANHEARFLIALGPSADQSYPRRRVHLINV
jgi:hypothetical protein